MATKKTKINLDAVFKASQLGLLNKSVSQTLGGLKSGHRRLLTPTSKDNAGYVFMTRPQLNLSSDNLIRHRPFFPLMTDDPNSMASWIRGTLDPRWAISGDAGGKMTDGKMSTGPFRVYSNQLDVNSPFINVVTNTVTSVSGFPDIDTPVFTSNPNRIGASFQMIDGVNNLNMPIDLTLTFNDMIGNPIYNLFRVLAAYPTEIYQGTLNRYPDFILEDTLDYNVRVFRLLMAPDGETIHSMASTYPGFVQGVAAGQHYDYNLTTPIAEDSTVSFRFMFSGVVYEDPILVDDFNTIMMYAHPNMRGKKPDMVKIPRHLLDYFSYERIYPYIDIETNKLTWWTASATYKYVFDLLNSTLSTAIEV